MRMNWHFPQSAQDGLQQLLVFPESESEIAVVGVPNLL
jgi:hypothetical protein